MANPLQNDGELQSLMSQLEGITDVNHFLQWRSSFVDRLEDFLGDTDGIAKARAADEHTSSKMSKLDKAIENVHDNCISEEDGSLKAGVKSQMAINKLKEGCIDMEKGLTKLVPSNTSEAKTCGYTKFHLGAVLVKDGFVIYKDMLRQELILQSSILPSLEAANVDRQILDAINYYFKRVRALVDVLTDLGLYKVMIKTNEFFPDEKAQAAAKKSSTTRIIAQPSAGQPGGQAQNNQNDVGTTKQDSVEPNHNKEPYQDLPEKSSAKTEIPRQQGQGGAVGGQPTSPTQSSTPVPTEKHTQQASQPTPAEPTSASEQEPDNDAPSEPIKKKQPATKAPTKKKKSKSKILPDSGGRGAKPTDNNNEKPKRYCVQPPKNPTPLTPMDDVKWEIKPQFNKNKDSKDQNKKSNSSNDDAGEEGDGDGDDDNSYLVFFDPLTQSMGMIPRQKCIQMGVITIGKDGLVEEGSDSPSERRGLLDMIQQSVLGRTSSS